MNSDSEAAYGALFYIVMCPMYLKCTVVVLYLPSCNVCLRYGRLLETCVDFMMSRGAHIHVLEQAVLIFVRCNADSCRTCCSMLISQTEYVTTHDLRCWVHVTNLINGQVRFSCTVQTCWAQIPTSCTKIHNILTCRRTCDAALVVLITSCCTSTTNPQQVLDLVYNKSTTNRSNGVLAFSLVMRRPQAVFACVSYLCACVPWLCKRPLVPSVCL